MAGVLQNQGVAKPATPTLNFASLASATITARNTNTKLVIETSEELVPRYDEIPVRVLIWGPEGTGKTHFGATFPGPVLFIDTEGRIPLIMPKFRRCEDCGKHWVSSDDHPTKKPKQNCGVQECPFCGSKKVKLKDIRRIKVNSAKEARDAMHLFIPILQKYNAETKKFGTIIVDNISKYWDWTQNEYAASLNLEINEKTLDPREHYKHINPKHNEEFRDILLSLPANVVLIATAKPIYDKDDRYKITGSGEEGQKHNRSAVDWVVTNMQGEVMGLDGKMMGNGVFTSYITKNSLIAAKINPVQFFDYNKLVELRHKLLVQCGVLEATPEEIAKAAEEAKGIPMEIKK